MREASIEKSLRLRLQRMGCLVYKFTSPGSNGVPDRIVVTPSGDVYFVELKTRTGELRPEQRVQLRRLSAHHANVRVIRGEEEADSFVREIACQMSEEVRYAAFN